MTNHSDGVARDMLNQVRVLSATPTLCRDHDPPASNPDSGPNLKSNSSAVLFQLTFHGPLTPPLGDHEVRTTLISVLLHPPLSLPSDVLLVEVLGLVLGLVVDMDVGALDIGEVL